MYVCLSVCVCVYIFVTVCACVCVSTDADLHKQLERPSVPAPTRESVTNKIGTLPTPLQVHVNANDAYNRLCS